MASRTIFKRVASLSRFYVLTGCLLMLAGGIIFLIPKTNSEKLPIGKLPISTRHPKRASKAWKYFHPTWKETKGWASLLESGKSKLSKITPNFLNFHQLIGDPGRRLGKDFEVPSPLRDRVSFWIDIYTKYDSKMKIVHDRYDLSIIYGYMDFRPLSRTIKSRVRLELQIRHYEKKILAELKARTLEAAGLSNSEIMDGYERGELKSFLSLHGSTNKKGVQLLLSGLRTQTGQRDMFQKALHRSQHLLPHIEAVFKKKQLPLFLARIPFVESSFNPRARSKAGAMGIWQFTEPTARELISSDNRSLWRDPLAQTRAAARLLKNYRTVLPDWGTTTTSYNSGVGNMRRWLRKYHAKNLIQLLANPRDNGMGFAVENFYSEVLAASLVEAYKEKFFGTWNQTQRIELIFSGKQPFKKEQCGIGI